MIGLDPKEAALKVLHARLISTSATDRTLSAAHLKRLTGHTITALDYLKRLDQLVEEGLLYKPDYGKSPRYGLTEKGQSIVLANPVLPAGGVLDPAAASRIIDAVKDIEMRLDEIKSNSDRAQAYAYASAIRALAEAPDPPADLIWTIANRANAVAGIASLFVAILALFLS